MYFYRGLDGEVRYAKVRISPNSGTKRSTKLMFYVHSHGGKLFHGRGGPEIPYRLPELHGGLGLVYVPESERSADMIVALGFRATTLHSIRRENISLLPEARYALMPDYDAAGEELSRRVEGYLAACDRWVTTFCPWVGGRDLPKGYGADDWIREVGEPFAKAILDQAFWRTRREL